MYINRIMYILMISRNMSDKSEWIPQETLWKQALSTCAKALDELNTILGYGRKVFPALKDLEHFPLQSAHEKSLSQACGITAHILTLHCSKSIAILELCKVGKMSTKTQVSQPYAFSLYMLVISVPDPLVLVAASPLMST